MFKKMVQVAVMVQSSGGRVKRWKTLLPSLAFWKLRLLAQFAPQGINNKAQGKAKWP
jgi:hypothetical protein